MPPANNKFGGVLIWRLSCWVMTAVWMPTCRWRLSTRRSVARICADSVRDLRIFDMEIIGLRLVIRRFDRFLAQAVQADGPL